MNRPDQPRRPLPLGLAALFFLVITGLAVAAIVRYQHFRQRVKETAAELRETLQVMRSASLGLEDSVLDRFERDIDQLEANHMPKLGRPVPLLAYIGPAPEVYLDDPPILTLYWLEAGQTTDGLVLETVSETTDDQTGDEKTAEIARVTGWANALSSAQLQELYGERFERYILVDVLIDDQPPAANNRDMVRITQEQLASTLTARLLYGSTMTDPIPVHVVPRLLKEPTAAGGRVPLPEAVP